MHVSYPNLSLKNQMDNHNNISDLDRRMGRSKSTVRRWERDGLLESERPTVVNCRVSSHGQKDDLHSQVDATAAMVAYEDLTAVITSKCQLKWFNLGMDTWAKGVLAEATDFLFKQLNTRHISVNGSVLQADHNAALNVIARLDDGEISGFTAHKEVRQILLSRSPTPLSVKGLELGAQARQPSADKSYAQMCATF